MAAALQTAPAAPRDSRIATLYAEEQRSLSAREAWALMAKSWPFIGAHRRMLAYKCILAFTSLTFFLLTPWPLKIIIDNVIDGHPLTGIPRTVLYPLAGDDRALLLAIVTGFLMLAAILVGVVGDQPDMLTANVDSGGLDQAGFTSNDASDGWSLWNGLFGMLEVWVTINLTQRINQTLRTAIYERFMRSPLKLYTDQKIGDALFRVIHDSASIGSILYNGILAPLLSIAAFFMGLLIVTAQFHDQPLIPILAAMSLPLIAIGSGLFGRAFRDRGQRMRERGSDVMAAFEERIANVQLIRAFGQEGRESGRVDAASWGSFSAALRMLALALIVIVLLAPAMVLLVEIGLYSLMAQVIAGKLTLGDVVLLGSYSVLLSRPMGILGSTWANLQLPIAGLRRIHSVLDHFADVQLDGADRTIATPIRELGLRGLSVAYDPAVPILRDVTMTLRAGELAALAGPSGAGKSTLIYTIPRFIEPCAGVVLLDGADAREFPAAAIRGRIAFVFQHEALFSATLADNIRYGSPAATEREVIAAATMAGAAEFIERLPDRYATMLGRRGARLSVGQRQRIAIARALLRNPDVLILDEPTAPLDPHTEAGLMRTLRRIADEHIVLLVAHRPETLAACDIVHFIDNGTVAISGPHAHLLESSAAYRSYLSLSTRAAK